MSNSPIELIHPAEIVEENASIESAPVPGGEEEAMMRAFAEFMNYSVADGNPTPDTIKAYYREVGMWVKWCHQNSIDPAKARRNDIEKYRRHLTDRNMQVATRQHKLSIVRRFYDGLMQYGGLENNPAAGVRGGKDLTPQEEKIKTLTTDALSKLLSVIPMDTLSGKRDRAIVALMAVHGLRRVEAHRLDHEHFEPEVLSISNSQLTQVTANLTGKGMKRRLVYLRPDTLDALRSYMIAKVKFSYPRSGPLFLAHGNFSRGSRLSRQSFNNIVNLWLGEANLKRAGVSCHGLRHTFGTLSVAGGAKLEHLKDAMGHANLETTGMYVRAVERRKNNPSNFIDIEV